MADHITIAVYQELEDDLDSVAGAVYDAWHDGKGRLLARPEPEALEDAQALMGEILMKYGHPGYDVPVVHYFATEARDALRQGNKGVVDEFLGHFDRLVSKGKKETRRTEQFTPTDQGNYDNAVFHGYARAAKEQPDFNLPVPNEVYLGTAAAQEGLDPYGHLIVNSTNAAEDARRGIVHPFSVQVGTPRVYDIDLYNSVIDQYPLVITPTQEWKAAFQKAMIPWEAATDDDSEGDIDARWRAEENGERLWRQLIDDARALAKAEGAELFRIEGGLEALPPYGDLAQVGHKDYATDLDDLVVEGVAEEGYLPGVSKPPAEKDLILYHGGVRPPGVVGIEYRPTYEGEGLEPLPSLAHKEAIWAADSEWHAEGYAESDNSGCYEEYGESCEPHVYTIDAADANMAMVWTKELSQRQADAVVKELLRRHGEGQVDVLRLERKSGGTEYFLPEGDYKPTLVRAEKRDAWKNEIPPVQTTDGLEFAPPSRDFCELKLGSLDNPSGDEYWMDRCLQEDARPGMDMMYARYAYEAERSPRPALPNARAEYWLQYSKQRDPQLDPTLRLLKLSKEKVSPEVRAAVKARFKEGYVPPRPGRARPPQGKGKGKTTRRRTIARVH